MEDPLASEREAKSRRFAASFPARPGEESGVGIVVIREAGEMEMLMRQRKAEGAVVRNFRLLSLAVVIAGLVQDTVPRVERVAAYLDNQAHIDPEHVRDVRLYGGELTSMAASADCFGFLAEVGNRVVEVAAKVIRIELPREQLMDALRAVRGDLLAVQRRVVLFPYCKRPVAPVPDAVVINGLAELRAFLGTYDDGHSKMDRAIILGGMLLQDARTAFRLLNGYERAVTNLKPLRVLSHAEDEICMAWATIDHLLGVLDGHRKDCTYLERPEYTTDGVEWNQHPIPSPAERLMKEGEETLRLGDKVSGFDAISVLGQKICNVAEKVSNEDADIVCESLRVIVSEIENTRSILFAFPV